MARSISRLNYGLSIFLATFFALSSLTACSGIFSGQIFRERATETPPPDDYSVDKSFFVDQNGKAKTFLCAWAPEVGRGWADGNIIPFENSTPHCNVEFQITENFLIAKLINPSFLDQPDRWTEFMRIPITKHYYYERNKDNHGRETNEWIENTSRSHWSARPKMKLDLTHTQISYMSSDQGSNGWSASSIEDIEWDNVNNFLGFSLNVAYHSALGGDYPDYQMKVRVNFLKFEHDPTFKKVPYDQENSRYMNVLHVMGRFIDGTAPELYAAHWDVRKTTRIYISGAPKEIQPMIVESIYRWNDEFVKIGAVPAGHQVFAPVVKDLPHPFDLRYPSITWISDRKLSMNAPLGVGMAHADVRNGQILWGGIVLWGGMLEGYINSYTPIENTAVGSDQMKISPLSQLVSMFQTSFPAVNALNPIKYSNTDALMKSYPVDANKQLQLQIGKLAASADAKQRAQADALRNQLADIKARGGDLAPVLADLSQHVQTESARVSDYFHHMTMQGLMGADSAGEKNPSLAEMLKKSGNAGIAKALTEPMANRREALLKSLPPNNSAMFVERDLTVANLVGGWMNSPAQKLRTYPEILGSIVASLTIHELGHVMGLGHEFKENIVPDEGTVPEHYIKDLSAKATAEKEFTNMTSVMGYQSGRTEMMTPAEDYKPGPQDDLVMRYIYKGEYATYNKGADDFTYFQVPTTGKIPEFTQSPKGTLRTSYFPACNDWEASLGSDPFCNRFDRGSNADDIVKNYFVLISDNLLTNLYSLVGAGGNPDYAQYRMWYRALDTMSRVRMFYDEMRRRLRSDVQLAPLWAQLSNDQDALFEFSKACMQDNPTDPNQVASATLRQIFAQPHMVDLCRANKRALDEYGFFLNLPESDYTRIDHNNHYIQGGYLAGDAIQNAGHIFGSWYQMTNLPLKFTALLTLTTSNPYMMGYWGLENNPFYDNEENRVQYRTLYPMEYTHLISSTVQSNMSFAAAGRDASTTIGRAVLAVGNLLWNVGNTSNDAAKLPAEFDDMLDQQTKFNYGMVAVIIDPVTPDPASNTKADHYKKFTASIYDFMTGKDIAARDVFLLPNGTIFVWAPGMFIVPITKMKFFGGGQQGVGLSSYVLAYKVDFDQGPRDQLVSDSLKIALTEKNEEIGQYCVTGFDGNGLLNYFDTSNPNFEGFKILQGIAVDAGGEKLGAFYDSVKQEFDKYEATANKKIPPSYPIKSMSRVCEESVRGMGQISAAAAMTNGFWLGITSTYLVK